MRLEVDLRGPQPKLWPSISHSVLLLVLLFTGFLACALAGQRFLHPFLLAGLQVKGVTFYFLNNVFRLHFPLEPTQGVFQRLAFLQSDFCQSNYTPKPVLFGLVSYCK